MIKSMVVIGVMLFSACVGAVAVLPFTAFRPVSGGGIGRSHGIVELLNGYFLVGMGSGAREVRRNPSLVGEAAIPSDVVALGVEGDCIYSACVTTDGSVNPGANEKTNLVWWVLDTVRGRAYGPLSYDAMEELAAQEGANRVRFRPVDDVFRSGQF